MFFNESEKVPDNQDQVKHGGSVDVKLFNIYILHTLLTGLLITEEDKNHVQKMLS